MKDKTTAINVRARNRYCVQVGYCSLYNCLRVCGDRDFHTEGIFGWNADIYELDGGLAIVTGYRPFGQFNLSAKFIKKWEAKGECALAALYARGRTGAYPTKEQVMIRRAKFRAAFSAAVLQEIGVTATAHVDNGARAA